MTQRVKLAFALASLAALAGCGIRGDLERPPPIFSDPADEEAMMPVDAPVAFAMAPEKSADDAYYNELGGEIPKPDPVTNIGEGGLDEIEPG